jgi:YhcH/YjgK/YiaL family protein
MIVDHISNWKQYPLGAAWESVFAFLSTLSRDAEEKEYPLMGEQMFARVMSYPTKSETAGDAVLESHRVYADIHMALIDSERIAVYPRHTLAVKDAYDPSRDVEFYTFTQKAALQLSMQPGSFALLLPNDAHMPGLHAENGTGTVKKVVVKVAMELLDLC